MPTTHIEVTEAKHGQVIWGLQDGHLLTVEKETPCFFFVRSHAGHKIKVSKKTMRPCYWKQSSTAPVFNI